MLRMEKEMATHSSALAWRIPGTGELGGLPSMGSHSRTRLKRLSSSSSNSAEEKITVAAGYRVPGSGDGSMIYLNKVNRKTSLR